MHNAPSRLRARKPSGLRTVLFWISFLAAIAANLFASGVRIYQQDAAAVAQGNAFVATADNPSAIYYNPAGITQLPGQNVRSGLSLFLYHWDYRSPAGATADSIDHLHAVPQFYYTCTLEKIPLSLGLGIYSPYGLGSHWSERSTLRSLAIRTDLIYVTANPVAAWKVNDRLSLAVGPTLNYADLRSRRGLFPSGVTETNACWKRHYTKSRAVSGR